MKTFLYILKGADATVMFPDINERNGYLGRWGEWIKSMMEKRVFISGLPLSRNGKNITLRGVSEHIPTDGDKTLLGYGFLTAETIDDATALFQHSPVAEADSIIELYEVEGMPSGVMK